MIEPVGPLRVGIVCPYSFDAPGGVQFHVRDLAKALVNAGHHASVLAPADEDTVLPPHVVGAGGALAVRYNGSVARLAFGPRAAARVRRWLNEGNFDILHLHEPATPSLSMLALWIAQGPIAATFHTSLVRSRALQIASPMVRPSLEKIDARIAVSEDARRTLIDHLGGDAVVIPNGVFVDEFSGAPTRPDWSGRPGAPTVAFLGRLDEPRKGLPVLTAAIPKVLEQIPGARFLIAGRGDEGEAAARAALGDAIGQVEFLGGVSDEDKASLLASVDAYVAPQTGGESFGIVLVEAMAAGTAVVASDLPAFERVLEGGNAGAVFCNEDADSLATRLVEILTDDELRRGFSERGAERALTFDWAQVTGQVLNVYQTVLAGAAALGAVGEDPHAESRRSRRERLRGEIKRGE
ncbi:glycosyltransferase family 4 protein [Rarobacter faecitabidus]|uniref:D-inositol 3-phosphate glycosyltransferase n=1 Tax=Rarobacter faecitabidus TaxID=13243 RepID=A0A542ZV39_RARFA|nr:glycosyltransferase family 4 protein [Rarobacter faecitabidus]TQL64235.1 phosphatidylinositol alpha-mannosyltransferase [Rarobacter faecitabidus]